jgi:hypothetical protein
VALRVSDVGLLRRRVRVEWARAEVGGKAIFGEPKDYERRAVPLPAFVVDRLAAHLTPVSWRSTAATPRRWYRYASWLLPSTCFADDRIAHDADAQGPASSSC